MGNVRTALFNWLFARQQGGTMILRVEDTDVERSEARYETQLFEDLKWLGLDWDEGPDISSQSGEGGQPGNPGLSSDHSGDGDDRSGHGGPFGPYSQSERRSFYLDAWRKLRDSGLIYPCTCSRKDLERVLSAPHEETLHAAGVAGDVPPDTDDEIPYPGTCREKIGTAKDYDSPVGVSWRFKVPDGETISFEDGYFGRQEFVAGRDFSDFLLWRRDDIPAYQLAVVVDDAAMQITEVVRGADLLKSTARQLLLIRALGYPVPAYFHCPLLRDEKNVRLAKRYDALSLRKLREQGVEAEGLRKRFEQEMKS